MDRYFVKIVNAQICSYSHTRSGLLMRKDTAQKTRANHKCSLTGNKTKKIPNMDGSTGDLKLL